MPPVLARDRRFDDPGRRSVKVACDVMFRPFRDVRGSGGVCQIECLRAPLGRYLEEERRFLVDGVYSFEVVRERPVPRVRTSETLTCACEPLLESCFNFQSRRRALSPFPFARRTAFRTAEFVFVQNCVFDIVLGLIVSVLRAVSPPLARQRRSLRDRPTPSPSRLFSGPLTETSLHLLVGDKTIVLDVLLGFSHRGQKRDLVGHIPIVDVIWEPAGGLKNLLFNAYKSKPTGTDMGRQFCKKLRHAATPSTLDDVTDREFIGQG